MVEEARVLANLILILIIAKKTKGNAKDVGCQQHVLSTHTCKLIVLYMF